MHLDSIYFQAGEITDFEGGDDVATNQFKSLNKIYFWKIWQIILLQENKSLNKIKNTIIHPQFKKKIVIYFIYNYTLKKFKPFANSFWKIPSNNNGLCQIHRDPIVRIRPMTMQRKKCPNSVKLKIYPKHNCIYSFIL